MLPALQKWMSILLYIGISISYRKKNLILNFEMGESGCNLRFDYVLDSALKPFKNGFIID